MIPEKLKDPCKPTDNQTRTLESKSKEVQRAVTNLDLNSIFINLLSL
jgi:hypothetical protein